MTGWGALLVPAAAALTGVVVTQVLTSRTESQRWQREEGVRVYESRRTAVAQYVLAANSAIDATRELLRWGEESPGHAARLADYHAKWHAMYERQVELLLLLPAPARAAVTTHLDGAFHWRDQARDSKSAEGAPRNEAVIESLQRWMHPGLPGE